MRRSRRLSGLQPDRVPADALKPIHKRAASKKKKATKSSSSSKKENTRPTRSARRGSDNAPAPTKRNASASSRSSSQRGRPKKSTPKTTSAVSPKRGRSKKSATKTAASARPRSRKSARTESPKKAPIRSRSAKRAPAKKTTVTPKQKKTPKRKSSAKKTTTATAIHRKTPRQTPASRRPELEQTHEADEKKSYEGEDDIFPPAPTFVDPGFADDDETYDHMDDDYPKWPSLDDEWGTEGARNDKTNGHSMDLGMFGIVLCLIAMYMLSFCRSMSCKAVTELPWISSMLVDFDAGATVLTNCLLYVGSFAYCRSWLRTDGYMTEEGSFVTLHFVHGMLLILHLVSCSIFNPNEKQSNCIESLDALSLGFYGAAWAMQFKFSVQLLRNSLTLAYLCLFYYQGKNSFGLVLLLAAKSVFWMTGAHMMEIINNERWSIIDVLVTVGCAFLAYLVPARA